MSGKTCRCGAPLTRWRQRICDRCRRDKKSAAERSRDRAYRGTPTQQGYGTAHKRLRDQVRVQVEAGLAVCARCERPIAPDEPWDLGHDDFDRSKYSGPEHRRCNRATAGRKPPTSREW